VRSAGGWAAVAALRRGREAYAADERILGSPEFVDRVRAAAAPPHATAGRPVPLATVLAAVAGSVGLPVAALAGRGRPDPVARAREGAAYLWCRRAGQSGRVLAATLGLTHQAVYAAATRGEQAAGRWEKIWGRLH
jgi:chromosomal replication initiation ATPase DnaA